MPGAVCVGLSRLAYEDNCFPQCCRHRRKETRIAEHVLMTTPDDEHPFLEFSPAKVLWLDTAVVLSVKSAHVHICAK